MKTYRMPQGKNEKRTACACGTLKKFVICSASTKKKVVKRAATALNDHPPPLYTYGFRCEKFFLNIFKFSYLFALTFDFLNFVGKSVFDEIFLGL